MPGPFRDVVLLDGVGYGRTFSEEVVRFDAASQSDRIRILNSGAAVLEDVRRLQRSGGVLWAMRAESVDAFDITDPQTLVPVGSVGDGEPVQSFRVRGGIMSLASGFPTAEVLYFDVSDPAQPIPLQMPLDVNPFLLAVDGPLLYVRSGDDLAVLDRQSPGGIAEIARIPDIDPVDAGLLPGRLVVTGGGTIRLLDVSDPSAPVEIDSVIGGSDIEVIGGFVYALWGDLSVFSVEGDDLVPITSGIDTLGSGELVWYGDRLIARGSFEDQISVFGVEDASDPRLLDRVTLPSNPRDMLIRSNGAYLLMNDSLLVYDLSDPDEPQFHARFELRYGEGMTLEGDTLVVATYDGPLALFDCSDPLDLVRSDAPIGEGVVNLVMNDGILAAFRSRDLDVYDFTDPSAPVLLSTLPLRVSGTIDDSWPYLYYKRQNSVFEILDLSDPTQPMVAGEWPESGRQFYADGTTGYTRGTPGTRIFDLTDPLAPTLLGVHTGSNGADALSPMGDRLVALINNPKRLRLADTSVPTQPITLETVLLTTPHSELMATEDQRVVVAGQGLSVYTIPVCSGRCGASDLVEPYGVLDLADITAFVNSFNFQLPLADFAEPFGVLDLADLVVFVTGFTAGCP